MKNVILTVVLLLLFCNTLVAQSKKEMALQFTNQLIRDNSQPFAYTQGNFQVGSSGAMQYEIPIICTPGIAGMTPKVTLRYNSNQGGGILGEGWSLNGLSIISRTNQSLVTDRQRGKIRFDEDDRLSLDGQRLIKINSNSATYWPDSKEDRIEYCTEINSFRRITGYYVNNEVTRFEVRTKEGLIYHYGAIGDTENELTKGYHLRTQDNNKVVSWLLVRIEDLNQNVVDFEYDRFALSNSFIKPTQINYTGRKSTNNSYFGFIKFNYKKVTPTYKYINGYRLKFDELLESVVSEFKPQVAGRQAEIVRRYIINYKTNNTLNKFYIQSIEECLGSNDCLETEFSWIEPQETASFNTNNSVTNLNVTLTEDYQIHLGDYNGDGLLDQGGIKNSNNRISLFLSRNNKGVFQKPQSFELPITINPEAEIIVNDFDANGTSDFAFCWAENDQFKYRILYTKRNLIGGKISQPQFGSEKTQNIDLGIDPKNIFYSSNDFNGNGLQDIYAYYYKDSQIKLTYGFNLNDDQFKPSPQLQSINTRISDKESIPKNTPINLGDYNSDGISDFLLSWVDNDGWKTKVILIESNFKLKEFDSSILEDGSDNLLASTYAILESKKIGIISDTIIEGEEVEVEVDSIVLLEKSSFQVVKNKNIPISKAIYSVDFNHDGNLDLVISNQNKDGWRIWTQIGIGNGKFQSVNSKPQIIEKTSYKYPHNQSFGDFNGDGQIDICIAYSDNEGWFTKISYGNGKGFFSTNPKLIKLNNSNFSYSTKQKTVGMLNVENIIRSNAEGCKGLLEKVIGDKPVPTSIVGKIDKSIEFLSNKIWSNTVIPTSISGVNQVEFFDNFILKDKVKEIDPNSKVLKRIKNVTLIPGGAVQFVERKIPYGADFRDGYTFDANCKYIGVTETRDYNKAYPEFLNTTFIDFWKPIIADFNGDGVTDLGLTYSKQPMSNIGTSKNELEGTWKVVTAINKASKSGVINQISLDNGAKLKIEYTNTSYEGAFDEDFLNISFPNSPYNIPLRVVKSTSSPNGLGENNTVEYEFKNGIIGLTGRGFLGFQRTKTTSLPNNSITEKVFDVDSKSLLFGLMPLKEVHTYINEIKINEVFCENRLFTDNDDKVVFNYVEKKEESSFDLNGEKVSSANTTNNFDDFGNLIYSKTQLPNGQIEVTLNEFYETSQMEEDKITRNSNLRNWIIGRLKKITIQKYNGSGNQIKRTTEFEYDPFNGQLKLEKSFVGSMYEVHKEFFYDEVGNKIKEKAFPVKNPTDITVTSFQYSDQYSKRFLTKKVDALGYSISYKPNSIFGFNEEIIDADGNKTTYDYASGNYDPFGRIKRTIVLDGNWTQERTFKCEACKVENAVYFKVNESTGSETATISFYDIVDRPIKSIKFDINYNQIEQDFIYNSKGYLIKSSLPYNKTSLLGAQLYYTEVEYDDLGRPVKNLNPDGTTEIIEYNGTRATTLNSKRQRNTVIKDLLGRKIFEINNLNDTVSYEYDLDGKIKSIIDQTGRSFSFNYDEVIGKLKSSYNPNFGFTKTIKYNYWGEVEEIRSGYQGKNITRFSYDQLGRLVRRTELQYRYQPSKNAPENTREDVTTFEYVPSGELDSFGKGRVKRITVNGDDRKLDKEFTYDQFGRLSSKLFYFNNYDNRSNLDNRTFKPWKKYVGRGSALQITYNYNDFGQIETITYPKLRVVKYKKDFVVKYNYQNGQVKSVDGNGQNLWEFREGNADGTMKMVAFADGDVITEFDFNTLNQNLQSISTTQNGSDVIQKWKYTYDELGNIKSRVDEINSGNFVELYEYDLLNRISKITLNNEEINYKYDPLGNFSYRSDLGYYRYRSHYYSPENTTQERKLTINKGKINSDRNDEGLRGDRDDIEYYYDLIGNRYKKEKNENIQFTIDFNHFNKPKTIDKGGKRTVYSYDENNNLEIEVSEQISKYYIDGLFEFEFREDEDNEYINQKYYIFVNGSLIAFNEIDYSEEDNFSFVHTDALGSITAITKEEGAKQIFAYDIWGQRVDPETGEISSNGGFTRGFTNHQHWDDLGLVNMGGRVFDPVIGQFLQVDPVLGFDRIDLGLTAYSYGFNNPLMYVDPTGYWSLKRAFKKFTRAVVRVFVSGPAAPLLVVPEFRNFIDKNAGTIVGVQGMILSTVLPVPPPISAFVTGFASSFAQSYLNGGTIGQSLKAGMISGTISGVTAGITAGIGDVFMGAPGSTSGGVFNSKWANNIGKATSHAAFQGMMNEAQGGNFREGAIPALVGSATDPLVATLKGSSISSRLSRTAIAATIGGTASELGGGKFSNGAMTAAVVHLYNFEEHYYQDDSDLLPFTADYSYQIESTAATEYMPTVGVNSETMGVGINVRIVEAGFSADYRNGNFSNYTLNVGVGFSTPYNLAGFSTGFRAGGYNGPYTKLKVLNFSGQVNMNYNSGWSTRLYNRLENYTRWNLMKRIR